MRQVAMVSALALWFWLAIGCQMTESGGKESSASSSPSSTNTPVSKEPERELPPGADQQVARAKQDLASRLGIQSEAVQVLDVEEVQWSDSSLGCPKPGMMYAQVITPGYRIQLEAEGKVYEYHADKGTKVVDCTK